MMLFVAMAWGSELPLPEMHPAPRWGRHDLAVGTGLWQVPSHGHGYPQWLGRVNLNATYTTAVTGRMRVGVHVAYQNVPYGPPDRDLRTRAGRVEPRFGWRLGSGGGRVDVDLALGVALDTGPWPIGPVLSVSPKFWLGEARRTFVALEARLAPLATMSMTFAECPQWCDQTFIPNPGGTGLLVSMGRSSPRVQAVRHPPAR